MIERIERVNAIEVAYRPAVDALALLVGDLAVPELNLRAVDHRAAIDRLAPRVFRDVFLHGYIPRQKCPKFRFHSDHPRDIWTQQSLANFGQTDRVLPGSAQGLKRPVILDAEIADIALDGIARAAEELVFHDEPARVLQYRINGASVRVAARAVLHGPVGRKAPRILGHGPATRGYQKSLLRVDPVPVRRNRSRDLILDREDRDDRVLA